MGKPVTPKPMDKPVDALPSLRSLCPALFQRDAIGITDSVDDFLEHARPYAAALGANTLAEVSRDTNPSNHQINGARVKAAMGLLKMAGAIKETAAPVMNVFQGPLHHVPSEKLAEYVLLDEQEETK